MSNLFNKYAEKAQHAINATPLGQYIPPQYQHYGGTGAPPAQSAAAPPPAGGSQAPPQSTAATVPTQPSSTPATTAAPAGVSSGGTSAGGVSGVLRQHGFSSLQNQLRNLQIQYSSKGPDRQVQLAITAQKSLSLQFEAAGRDAQVYSKELYLWGQDQPEDIKDVTDRLAYLNFMHGQFSADLANNLDAARAPWKTARATEGTMGTLRQAGQATDAMAQESAVEKRRALTHGEASRWKAIREYAEKLILLSQASEVLIDECLPNSSGGTYTAKQRTAEVRSTLQQSLDSWYLNPAIAATSPFKAPSPNASALDVRGFGETHRQELERTPSVVERQKADQEALDMHNSSSTGVLRPGPTTTGTGAASAGVNPAQLNNTPAPVPIPANASAAAPPTAGSQTIPPTAPLNVGNNRPGPGSGVGAAAAGAGVAVLNASPSPGAPRPVVTADIPPSGNNATTSPHPTLAETGVPITSAAGPGPSSGSLRSGAATTATSPTWGSPVVGGGAKYETAEEEKRRLEREDRERFLRFGTGLNKPGGTGGGTSPNTSASPPSAAASANTGTPTSGTPGLSSQRRPETAEEEKRRLEREERERVLRGESTSGGRGGSGGQPPRRNNPDDPNAEGEQLPSYKP